GFSDSVRFEQIGSEFRPLEDSFSQGMINGAILFAGADPYGEYRRFTGFARADPLTLSYRTDETYNIAVRLVSIEKSELGTGGSSLVCNVTFAAEGLFYRSVKVSADTKKIGGKVYPFKYPYTYEDVSQNTVLIESGSRESSPCRITVYGQCVNPKWKHYVNNVLTKTGAYIGTVPAGNRLVIDTTAIPYSIKELGVGGKLVANRYQQCDFSTERFFHLQYGSNRISVSHDGLNALNVFVEGRISYETV
ncbi:MAG: hypothetical protein NC085_05510, partial [Muribaculaceae bacterium]|nr:hypothetical protein [Muribaculaceae bacterium]